MVFRTLLRSPAVRYCGHRLFLFSASLGAIGSDPASASSLETPDLEAATAWEGRFFVVYQDSGRAWTLEAPMLDITFPIAGGAEASATVGRLVTGGAGSYTRSGWADLALAAKWELIPIPELGGFGLSVEPGLSIPVEGPGSGAGAWRGNVASTIGWQGGRFAVRASIGYDVPFDGGGKEAMASAAITYDASAKLRLGMELVHRAARFRLNAGHAAVNLGIEWETDDKLTLMARFGSGLRRQDCERSISGALFVQRRF